MANTNVKYVKFMRGTEAKYNNLATKDQDTLYFVYTDVSAQKGKLYLGNKLISGSSEGGGGVVSLADLGDVLIENNLADGDILVYDDVAQKWVNTPLGDITNVSVMVGATRTKDGKSGLVPVPTKNDVNKVLGGNGQWVAMPDISNLQATVATLVDTDVGKSVAQIAAEQVASLLIPGNAKEELDTLQEIADWIQSHPDSASSMNTQIINLNTQVGNLNTLITGENGLSARVTALETATGDLAAITNNFTNVSSALTSLNTSVTEINERLRWHELDEA